MSALLGAAGRHRTGDLSGTSRVLCRLSYSSKLAGGVGIGPTSVGFGDRWPAIGPALLCRPPRIRVQKQKGPSDSWSPGPLDSPLGTWGLGAGRRGIDGIGRQEFELLLLATALGAGIRVRRDWHRCRLSLPPCLPQRSHRRHPPVRRLGGCTLSGRRRVVKYLHFRLCSADGAAP